MVKTITCTMNKENTSAFNFNDICRVYLPQKVGYQKYLRVVQGSLVVADVSGFTKISEQLGNIGRSGTEELTLILDKFFEELLFIIRLSQGNVLKFIGDAILVNFDHVDQARNCSVQMLDKVLEYKNLQFSELEFSLAIKIVIGTGSWVECILGNRTRAEFFQSGTLLAKLYQQEKTIDEDQIKEIDIQSDIAEKINDFVYPDPVEPVSFLADNLFGILEKSSFGEHRPVSCVFVKVSNYNIDNPNLTELDKLFLELYKICQSSKGSINTLDNICSNGFKILIIFGAPLSYGNDTLRAVQAAWQIDRLNEQFNTVDIKVSINSGYVYSGMIGDEERRHYTVIGDVVNSASRLVDSLENPGIVVSKNVFRITSKYIEFKKLLPVKLKGKKNPEERFTPVRIKEKINYQYDFIGRDLEKEKVIGEIKLRNSVILITGDAGIGKTRLIDEVKSELLTDHYNVVKVKGEQLKPAYGIFADMIKDQTAVEESDSDIMKQEKIDKFIEKNKSRNLDDFISTLPIIGKILFNLEYPESLYYQMTPEIRRENLFDGIRYFLMIIPKPAVIFVDDLQLIKNEDFEALNYIIRTLLLFSNENISFVLTSRPDSRTLDIDTTIEIRKINLQPLPQKQVRKLILNILGGNPLEDNLHDFILSKTGCNPMYLEQFLLYMLENDFIVLKNQNWIRCSTFHQDNVPESLFSIILARIDKFQEDIKEIIRLASVIGIEFKEELIENILRRKVHLELESAENEGIIDIKNKLELEYIFSHALIRDVVYESILNETRKLLHGMVAQIIETVYRKDSPSYFSLIAYHYDYSEDYVQAVEYYVKAGQKAQQEYRNDEAVKYYQRILELLNIINNPHLQDRYFHKICLDLLDIFHVIGSLEQAVEYIDSLLLEPDIDESLRRSLLLKKVETSKQLGDWDQALKSGNELVDKVLKKQSLKSNQIEPEQLIKQNIEYDDLIFFIELYTNLAEILRLKQHLNESLSYAQQVLDMLDCLKTGDVKKKIKLSIRIYSVIGGIYFFKCDYERAAQYFSRGIDLCEQQGNLTKLATFTSNLGVISHTKYEHKKALELYQQSYRISKKAGYKQGMALGLLNSGCIYNDLSQSQQALDSFFKALKIFQEINSKHDVLTTLFNIGNTYNNLENYEDALVYAEQSLLLAKEIDDVYGQARIYNIFANIYKKSDDYSNAYKYYQIALNITEDIQDYPWLVNIIVKFIELLFDFKKYEEIPSLIRKGYRIARSIDYQDNIAEFYCHFSKISLIRNENSTAEKYLKLAEAKLPEIDDNEITMIVMQTRVNFEYNRFKDGKKFIPDQIKKLFVKFNSNFENILKEMGNRSSVAAINGVQAKIYELLRDPEAADQKYKNSIRLYRQINRKHKLMNIYQSYGEFLIKQNNENGKSYLNKSEQIKNDLGLNTI